jgi:hypothetical protein
VSAGEEEMPWEEDDATSAPTGSSQNTPAKHNDLPSVTSTSTPAVAADKAAVEDSKGVVVPSAGAAAAGRVDPSQSIGADLSPIALSTAKSSFGR